MRAFLTLFFLLVFATCGAAAEAADKNKRFSFHDIKTVMEMELFIQDNFPLGTKREELHKTFVLQGNATLKNHPTQTGVEKYLYDINLCNYYVFRWNISVDFDADGLLVQAYINGLPVFLNGRPRKRINFAEHRGSRVKLSRQYRDWPQADKGAKRLYYTLLDMDSDPNTIDDQALVGYGASRADPADFGKLVKYAEVEPWRSIYDDDQTIEVYDYKGSCKPADAKMIGKTLNEPQHGILK